MTLFGSAVEIVYWSKSNIPLTESGTRGLRQKEANRNRGTGVNILAIRVRTHKPAGGVCPESKCDELLCHNNSCPGCWGAQTPTRLGDAATLVCSLRLPLSFKKLCPVCRLAHWVELHFYCSILASCAACASLK